MHRKKVPGYCGWWCMQCICIGKKTSIGSQERRVELWISFQKSFAPVLMSCSTIIPTSTPPSRRIRTRRIGSQRYAASLRFPSAHLLHPQSVSALHLIIAKTANAPDALLQDLAFCLSGNSRQDDRTRWTDRLRWWSGMAYISVLGWEDC